jgi:hypothetical protein
MRPSYFLRRKGRQSGKPFGSPASLRNSHASWHPLRNLLLQDVPFLGIYVSEGTQPYGDALINSGEQAKTP